MTTGITLLNDAELKGFTNTLDEIKTASAEVLDHDNKQDVIRAKRIVADIRAVNKKINSARIESTKRYSLILKEEAERLTSEIDTAGKLMLDFVAGDELIAKERRQAKALEKKQDAEAQQLKLDRLLAQAEIQRIKGLLADEAKAAQLANDTQSVPTESVKGDNDETPSQFTDNPIQGVSDSVDTLSDSDVEKVSEVTDRNRNTVTPVNPMTAFLGGIKRDFMDNYGMSESDAKRLVLGILNGQVGNIRIINKPL